MTKFLGNLINFEESTIRPTSGFQDSTASGVFNLHEQLMLNKQSLWPTAGVDDPARFVENLFSVDVYTGNSGTQTITNGIDLSGEGGLVWIKIRDYTNSHQLYDTARGAQKPIYSNLTNGEGTNPDFASFNSTGFTLGYTSALGGVNGDSNDEYVAWTFRKAPKFFDVVTYTGDNSSSARDIAHSLGQAPGMIMIKRYNDSGYGWLVWHRSLSNGYWLRLDTTDAQENSSGVPTFANNDQQTSTHFQLSATNGMVNYFNASGQSYVAYLFGHDTSSDGMIQCGSYTGNGSATGPAVDLGFEPQWVMIKQSSASGQWWNMIDTIRGFNVSTGAQTLGANDNAAEYVNANFGSSTPILSPTATGFQVRSNQAATNTNGATYTYMAIRKAPMQTPTSRSSVFVINNRNSTGSSIDITSNFPVDWFFTKTRDSAYGSQQLSRLQGPGVRLGFYGAFAEQTDPNFEFDHNNKVVAGSDTSIGINRSGDNNIDYMFRRAPNFFEIVTYTASGSAMSVTHKLGVAPEMVWVKKRSGSANWTFSSNFSGSVIQMSLNNNDGTAANDYVNSVTSTTFTLGGSGQVISSGDYIAYLFATLAGISKVGTFSHTNGSSTDVDCGFSSGSSFVIAKRTDAAGSWYIWDSTRGIVSGNDPYWSFNTQDAEVTNTDYIDPLNSGFQIASGFTTGSYIFYAIAS